MILEIICPLGGADAIPYSEFLRSTGESLKSGSHEIRWNSISEKKINVPGGFTGMGRVDYEAVPGTGVGMNTGTCYNVGIDRIKNSDADFVFFMDSDIALLAKNWDAKIINELENHDVVGIMWNNENSLKFLGKGLNWHQSFPLPAFMGFRIKLCKELNWDMCPDKKGRKNRSSILNKKEAKICGVPIGTKIKRDTGWRIPYFFHEKGYVRSLVMKEILRVGSCSMPYESKKDKKYCDKHCAPLYMAEYYLAEEAFCTHLSGSRHNGFSSKVSRIWRSRVRKYINDNASATSSDK